MAEEKVLSQIAGMTCEGCAQGIQNALKRVKGVNAVKVNWRSGQGEVTFDTHDTSELKILEHPIFQGHYSACLVPSGGCCPGEQGE